MVVAFVGPGLALAAVQEHLHAAPHQVLPARPHGGVEGALLLDLNQLACGRRGDHGYSSSGCIKEYGGTTREPREQRFRRGATMSAQPRIPKTNKSAQDSGRLKCLLSRLNNV